MTLYEYVFDNEMKYLRKKEGYMQQDLKFNTLL